ncbi:hypothetical protein Pan44_12550 [Caulifigura coniformis]|uniref:DUF2079 domain-containing protein n=1 Tax=Caulifigura coniformis TaxID=2527983 RepID=A0A517SAU3_9PLAN|nr:DUF2079 domain-containing protein [Caulifigura coniformis]QDT53239.1 hypothetical protein Pan44_12550 [Caulifigura coniformis]
MPPSSEPTQTRESGAASPAFTAAVCALSLLGLALFVQTILESAELSLAFLSEPRWRSVVSAFGGRITTTEAGPLATVSLGASAGWALLHGLALTALGALLQGAESPLLDRLLTTARRLSRAWAPAGIWWLLWITALLSGWTSLASVLHETADLTVALCLALSALAVLPRAPRLLPSGPGASRWSLQPKTVLAAGILLYVVVFTAMNWGLWFNLRIPHGDSAMYEEHLWNLEHGKGFRSYLDQGLFLGEHLQVVHVLLVPIHALFPSHLTLELAQSIILALGAWPVFNIARRHSGSEWAAALLGLAYLAYFPLQYLDIAIDLKTFRPNSFGIPTLLVAIDLLERRRYGWATFWLAITLSAQEDWAIPIALLGAYFAVHAFCTSRPNPSPRAQLDDSVPSTGEKVAEGRMRGQRTPATPESLANRRQLIFGIGLFLFSIAYLWFALNVVIPWFRGGATVHTASYFSKFGNSPREIIVTLLTDWPLVFSTIVTPAALVYALRLLLPIGFLPLRSPGRLLVAAPLFLLLLMNDLAMQVPAPVHHFHAPLIPILFWAAASGLGTKVALKQST